MLCMCKLSDSEEYLAFRHVSDFLLNGNFHGITDQRGVPSAAAGLLMIINRASEEPQTTPGIYRIIKKQRKGWMWMGLVSVGWSHMTCVAHSSSFGIEICKMRRK